MVQIILFVLSVLFLALLVYCRMLYLKLKEARMKKDELTLKNHELNALVHSSELSSIRYKLNPHLFKNALNSIQSHAYQTYYSMDKLSGVLDYILYESDQPLVSLQEEMDFAANFIEINRLKLSPLFDLRIRNTINLKDDRIRNLKILPLITVDLIENAFKHTDFQKSESFISIHLEITGNEFLLEVSNRISESKPLKKERSGLGIKNLEERLNIAYPNAYELTLNNDNPVFHARLKLKLNG
ncbi:sensor histidine kinase [uncultured Fluviicola sp.]|uniref:sensor histidine kinase n=1 Tax=uncultured Fluviicola sp. TaxID=463303 RepID=UPI0025E8A8C1|nr:histidine kinase [uncultured Fluviicola sp.]